MKKAFPFPWKLEEAEERDPKAPLSSEIHEKEKTAAEVENEHVKNVYDSIAKQWHGTRYKAWPKVEAFIRSQPNGSFFGDVGCGNGKNLPACNKVGYGIGCDISIGLAEIATEHMKLEVPVADIMNVPYKSGSFDCVLCIAVLHHISTRARRLRAISECMRVVRVGGQALFYAWAQEQEGGFSGHRFEQQDVMVPFHLKHDKPKKAKISNGDSPNACREVNDKESHAAKHAVFDETKNATVFQRYCHVYKSGELEGLFTELGSWVTVEKVYWDTGNWAIIARRLS